EGLFAEHLGGHDLMTNAAHIRGSAWLQFRRVLCHEWRHHKIILLGDAAHTAHFSIGSGTKLALEDAIELSRVLTDGKSNALNRRGLRRSSCAGWNSRTASWSHPWRCIPRSMAGPTTFTSCITARARLAGRG